jgi:hypothetical protein
VVLKTTLSTWVSNSTSMDKFDVTVTLVFKNIEADRGQDAISACIERLDDGYDNICAEAQICEPIRPGKKIKNN